MQKKKKEFLSNNTITHPTIKLEPCKTSISLCSSTRMTAKSPIGHNNFQNRTVVNNINVKNKKKLKKVQAATK